MCISAVISGCREQERNECESICRKNAKNETYCELRAALILPNSPKIEASMPRVRIFAGFADRHNILMCDFYQVVIHILN